MADLTRSQLVSGTQGIFAKNESDACPGLDPTRSAAPVRKCPKGPESVNLPTELISFPLALFRELAHVIRKGKETLRNRVFKKKLGFDILVK